MLRFLLLLHLFLAPGLCWAKCRNPPHTKFYSCKGITEKQAMNIYGVVFYGEVIVPPLQNFLNFFHVVFGKRATWRLNVLHNYKGADSGSIVLRDFEADNCTSLFRQDSRWMVFGFREPGGSVVELPPDGVCNPSFATPEDPGY